MATHRVGGEVDAFCARCKLTLAHTILAMVGSKVARVRCNTCNADHSFRSTPARTRAASTARATHQRVVLSFEEQLAGKDVAHAPRYSPKDSYRVDQLIDHPSFGVGIVSGVREDKVDVVFKFAQKTLVHARAEGRAVHPTFEHPRGVMDAPQQEPDPREELDKVDGKPDGG